MTDTTQKLRATTGTRKGSQTALKTHNVFLRELGLKSLPYPHVELKP